MDATRIRTLIDGALDAQSALEAAAAAVDATRKAFDDALERHRKECGNLQAALNSVGAVAYGDRLIRVGPPNEGRFSLSKQWVHVVPLVSVPVVAPLLAPLPEAEAKPEAKPAPAPKTPTAPVAALSAGKVPEIRKAR